MSELLALDGDIPPLLHSGKVVKAADLRLLREATEVLEKAREHAAEVNDSLGRVEEEARSRGESLGLEEGRREAAVQHWKTVLSTVSYLGKIEDALIRTVTDSLRRIVMEIPPQERIVQLVGRALQDLSAVQKVVVNVHPDDVRVVTSEVNALEPSLPAGVVIEVRQRPDLSPGSCLLETPLGVVDASLEAQLQAMHESLSVHPKVAS
jgi:type III secretion protein L